MDMNLAILIAGILLLVWAVFFSGDRKVMEDTPTSKVRSVAMGFAELKGAAKPRVLLTSPYSNFPCVYYKYTVEVESNNGKHTTRSIVREGGSGTPFYLDDGTGKILVSPKGAQLRLRNNFQCGEYPEIVTEWCIMAGTELYVAGTVGKVSDFSAADFDQGAHYRQELARLQGMLADVDLKPGEWAGPAAQETARVRIRKDIQDLETKVASSNKAAGGAPADEIAVGKGEAESTFLISDMTEGELTQQMAYSSSLALAAAIGMIVYALWALTKGPF